MSKNLTRKGLALGAVVALGTTLIAGTPASAANEVTLATTVGTTYGAISGHTFTLQASTGATISSGSYGKLKYSIANAGALAVTTAFAQAGSTADSDLSAAVATTGVVKSTTGTVTGSTSTLAVSIPATSAGTVTVTAWVDSNDNDVIDSSTEFVSGAQTITFVKAADVAWTTEFTKPVAGDVKFLAYVSSSNVNVAQLSTELAVVFKKASVGATTNSANVLIAGDEGTYDSTTGKLKFNPAVSTDSGKVLAATVYSAQLSYDAANDGLYSDSGDLVGSSIDYSTDAATIATLDSATATASDDIKVASATSVVVRNGTTSVPLSVQAYKTGTTVKAAAGQTVNITLTEKATNGNTDAATFISGGKTLQDTTSASESITFAGTTDADGVVNFTVAVAGTVAGTDTFVVTVAAQNATLTNASTTVSFVAQANEALADANLLGTNAILKVAAGSTYALKFAAVDQFGKGLGSGYRVLLTESAGATTATADLVNGLATFSVTDKTTLSESYSAQLQKYSTTNLRYEDVSANAAPVTIAPTVGTSAAAAAVTLAGTSTTGLALNLNAQKSADARVGEDAPTVVSTGTIATLSGTVSDAATLGTYSSVKLSATGALFKSGSVYSLDSITVLTNASGVFDGVTIYSQKSGDVVVTATAGTATKTLTLTFTGATEATGTVLSIVAPEYALPGSTLDISAVLTDKYGNGVLVANTAAGTATTSVTYVGPGLLVANPTQTLDSKGASKFRVLLGVNDSGTATVTFTYDADGTGTVYSKVTKTATITIGAAPVAAPAYTVAASGSTGKFFVSATGAANKTVVVKVAGKFVKSFKPTSADKKAIVIAATKGSKAVTVFVGGKLALTKTVTVK